MSVTDLTTDKEMEDQDKEKEDKDEKRRTVMMEMTAVKKKTRLGGSGGDMEWVDLRRSDQMKELIIELPRPWWQAKEISVDDQTLFWEDEEQDYNSGTEKQNQQKRNRRISVSSTFAYMRAQFWFSI